MKIYRVYSHPTKGMESIMDGASWPALFFGFLWMGVNRFWGRAGLWFAASVALMEGLRKIDLPQAATNEPLGYLVLAAGWLGLNLIGFFKGNGWREEHLKASGYEFLERVSAENAATALSRMRGKISLLAERDLLSSAKGGHAPLSLDTTGRVNPTAHQKSYRDTAEGQKRENESRWKWF